MAILPLHPSFSFSFFRNTTGLHGMHHSCETKIKHDVYPLRAVSGCSQDAKGFSQTNYTKNIEKIRSVLSQTKHDMEAMVLVDTLKRLCIDYHFRDQISNIISTLHENTCKFNKEQVCGLAALSLHFRLLREAGYDISPDIFERFMDQKGDFKLYLSKDIKGLLSLHEASYLNIGGEEILYKANEFSTSHMKSLKHLEPNLGSLVRHTLEHPYHVSLPQYKARHFITHIQSNENNNCLIKELSLMEFEVNQVLHQKELQELISWCRSLGISRELTFARDQIVKWYVWALTGLPAQQLSKLRIELTKVIAFVYIIDDIFDVIGSPDDLTLFAKVIDKWDHELACQLPEYMRICYISLEKMTNDIGQLCSNLNGWNPTHYLRKSWGTLCKAFLLEAGWLANKREVPTSSEYLRNGIITSGVPLILEHLLFLLGHRAINGTMQNFDSTTSPLISCPAKILRLWDDLGNAKDEKQEGYDGSYLALYMKENPNCSRDDGAEHVHQLISEEWEKLNREYFSISLSHGRSLISPNFTQACLNCARMVRVMYTKENKTFLCSRSMSIYCFLEKHDCQLKEFFITIVLEKYIYIILSFQEM